MANLQKKTFIKDYSFQLTILFFYLSAFLYIRFKIDPRLFYYDKPELFLKTYDFFKTFAIIPGGITTYAAKFFFQFNYFPLLGSFIIVLFLAFIGLFHININKKVTQYNVPVLMLIPLILVIFSLNQYIAMQLIKTSIILLAIIVFLKFSPQNTYFNIIYFFCFFTIIFYLTKDLSWLFFAISAIYEIHNRQKKVTAAFYILIFLFIYYLDFHFLAYLQYGNITNPLSDLAFIFSFDNLIELVVLALILASVIMTTWRSKRLSGVLFILVFLISFYHISYLPIIIKVLFGYFITILFVMEHLNSFENYLKNHLIIKCSFIASTTVLLIFLIIITFNKTTNAFLKLNYYSQNRSWNDVLKVSKKIPAGKYDNISISPFIIKALYYTNKLPFELFNYPHLYPPGIRTITTEQSKDAISQMQRTVNFIDHAQTCIDLGLINYAEVMVYYTFEYSGDMFPSFQQLAQIYILKENYEAANVILNMLNKNLIRSDWANQYLSYIEDNNKLLADKYLMRIKSRTIKDDEPVAKLMRPDFDYVMERLLSQNLKNKMAYEYMMTYFLLTGQTDKITENIYLLDYYNIVNNSIEMPKYWEEAVVINCVRTKNYDPEISQRKINAATMKEFVDFDKKFKLFTGYISDEYKTFFNKYFFSYFLYYKSNFKR